MRLPDKSPSINKQPALQPRLVKLQCLRTTSLKLRLPFRRNAPFTRELWLRLESVVTRVQRDIFKCVLWIL